ncbi:MAG: lipopolysaccharide heptosyltransferase II [Candidatus Saccharicenans sp.]
MKILVCLPRPLGSALLAIPFLRSLQTNFPSAQIFILLEKEFTGLFRLLLPEYQQLVRTDLKDIPALKAASTRLKRIGFDLGILLEDSFSSALLFYLARIPQRWGYDHEGRGFMLTRKLRLKAVDPQLHLKYYYLNILKKLGLKVEDQVIKLELPSDHRPETEALLSAVGLDSLKPIIALKPGSSYGLSRIWPLSYQLELIKKLLSNSFQVILIGSEASQESSRQLRAQLDGRIADLCGCLSLEKLPGLMVRCQLYIGNDGGLIHLANFLGIPVVGLYGPSDPSLCGPVQPPSQILKKQVPCSPCSYKHCPYDHRCLMNISAEEVWQAASGFLGK